MAKPQMTDEEFKRLAQGLGSGAHAVETKWPPDHDWEENTVCMGVVAEVETVKFPDRTSRRASVKTDKGEVSLWESSQLRKLFDMLKVGDSVLVQFTGIEALEGAKTQRTYRVVHKAGR